VEATRTIPVPEELDLPRTVFPLRRGTGDPTIRIEDHDVWRALLTPEGSATLRVRREAPDRVIAAAWGPGAGWALEDAPGFVGALDDPAGFAPRHPVLADAWKRYRGIRLTTTGTVFPILVAAVCEQKVTGIEARRAWRGLVGLTGLPAPQAPDGPPMRTPPDPHTLASIPSFALHRSGLERRRADLLRGLAERARRIDALADRPSPEAQAWLRQLPGIGPWTAAETARLAFGDPDAVSVGDYHLPNLVCWALAGEPRGGDARMLELLAPYEGQRGRVQRLLEVGGRRAPAYGPRTEARSIAGI
jgi:3-methyladenine DNA glycosylase/8-oxoguanine DNA glycosylase